MLYQTYAPEGLIVLGVMEQNLSYAAPDVSDLLSWMDESEVTFPVLADVGFSQATYGNGTPNSVIIDREMRIVHDNFYHVNEWQLAELFE